MMRLEAPGAPAFSDAVIVLKNVRCGEATNNSPSKSRASAPKFDRLAANVRNIKEFYQSITSNAIIRSGFWQAPNNHKTPLVVKARIAAQIVARQSACDSYLDALTEETRLQTNDMAG